MKKPTKTNQKNHEIWRICPNCGQYEDIRKTNFCTKCQKKL